MASELEHHAAFVNGVRLHYVRAGEGDPVVLLHGWPQTWYMWRKVIPALAERYTVIAPDLRGFGESSKPLDGYDKRTVAEDIYQLVRQLGFEKVFLVGHDMGGPTAYAYACAHPADVRRLVILDVAITIDEATAASYYTRLFHLSFHAEPDIAVALVSGRERTYLTHFYRNCYNPGAFSHEDIDEYVAAFSAPGAMRASMAHYGALWTDLEHNKENAKRPLEMPVLALGGEISFGDGALKSARKIAKDVRGGTIPRCAHWVAEEQPEALVRELLAFFGEE
ncbi:MAG: alpha/beta hydrolase [Deltaproteobacteria bacterium]|jgi:pimeloyl-ACP methyl ester carboxylesterase|nr:alpha/beta hydrolase [Deltaproteobacteria bacterium]MBW2499818.1 alpha/beta hydrolase [Deltaproteobacteria bacterium]